MSEHNHAKNQIDLDALVEHRHRPVRNLHGNGYDPRKVVQMPVETFDALVKRLEIAEAVSQSRWIEIERLQKLVWEANRRGPEEI